MTYKAATMKDLLNSEFHSYLCEGDENAAELLGWMVRTALEAYAGRPVAPPATNGTPEFRTAHLKLKALGLVKPNPARGLGENYHELAFLDLAARYESWARGEGDE